MNQGQVWVSGIRYDIQDIRMGDGRLWIDATAEMRPEEWTVPAGRHATTVVAPDGSTVLTTFVNIDAPVHIHPGEPATLNMPMHMTEHEA